MFPFLIGMLIGFPLGALALAALVMSLPAPAPKPICAKAHTPLPRAERRRNWREAWKAPKA